jgi:hypothetical protein
LLHHFWKKWKHWWKTLDAIWMIWEDPPWLHLPMTLPTPSSVIITFKSEILLTHIFMGKLK